MIISKFVSSSSNPISFKAPKNHMYNIFDIHMSVTSGGNALYAVLNYLTEELTGAIVGLVNKEGIIAAINSTIAGQAEDFNFTLGEKCKFITLVRDAGAGGVFILIHYELIKASKQELIIEWFRKGR